MNKKALIYIEINNPKETVSKEIISKINTLSNDIEIDGVVISDEMTIRNNFDELKQLKLDKLYLIKDNLFDTFQTCLFANVLSSFLKENNPDIFLMGATENGRDLAPRTASTLDIGLTADCTELQLDENANLLATRPTYGGKMMATIISKTKPNFATVRPGAFKENASAGAPEIIEAIPAINGHEFLIEVLKCEPKPQIEDWTCADVIVAGGLGLKTKENFEKVYEFCQITGAKPAASRAAVELGWAPSDIQVGQTGCSVCPKLYIALGISGAMQHMAGITNADRIIAVNTDKYAPIMQASDTAIVADACSILQNMIDECTVNR